MTTWFASTNICNHFLRYVQNLFTHLKAEKQIQYRNQRRVCVSFARIILQQLKTIFKKVVSISNIRKYEFRSVLLLDTRIIRRFSLKVEAHSCSFMLESTHSKLWCKMGDDDFPHCYRFWIPSAYSIIIIRSVALAVLSCLGCFLLFYLR